MTVTARPVRRGPLVCTAPRADPQRRVFCVPYAGGGPGVFRDWHPHLEGSVELWAAELPGRGRRLREPPSAGILPAAAELERALWPLLDRPYVLFGHSMGALVAYELARRLAAAGRPPLRLVVSGSPAPGEPRGLPPVAGLGDYELLDAVQPLGGLPDPVLDEPELLEIVLPILRADLVACERYVESAGPPLPCPITALAGDRDRLASAASMEPWAARTVADFRLERFAGGHFFLESARVAVVRSVAVGIGAAAATA